ncbi:MAG: hypothetical protein FJ303_16550 [Planctomycetes bacterium]|nr:hypothetical protein [Planctomycetota bacterium]
MHDWDAFEAKLFAASIGAIKRFADEHPIESICFLPLILSRDMGMSSSPSTRLRTTFDPRSRWSNT